MAQAKKHYKVDVYIYGESAFTPFRKLHKTIETWAVSADKAESNARYRNEGRAFGARNTAVMEIGVLMTIKHS